jgi:FdhD protein
MTKRGPAPVGECVSSRRVVNQHGLRLDDVVAIEEPLEIRVAGETVAVTMRTRGDDAELALGFLFAEGVLRSVADVGAIFHCGRTDEEGYGNSIEVTPAAGAHVVLRRLDSVRRGSVTTSACGVCGRQTIEDLLSACGVIPDRPQIDGAVLANAPSILRATQKVFELTGGVHGAAALDAAGTLLTSAEDVGRHNAVDKVIGALLKQRLVPASEGPGQPAILVVSSRASFELVQKAAMARFSALVAVGAASSLAIDLARRVHLRLLVFTRNGAFVDVTPPEP